MSLSRKALALCTLLFVLAGAQLSHGVTSYLAIQGNFGAGEQTLRWQVDYQAGSLTTGLDLLMAVFGTPTSDGTYQDGFAGEYYYFSSTNGTNGAAYFDFNSDTETGPNGTPLADKSLFLESFTINGVTQAMVPDYSSTWSNYVSGGTGNMDPGNPDGIYDSGVWTYANEGITQYLLGAGSIFGWTLGALGDDMGTVPASASYFTGPILSQFGGTTPGGTYTVYALGAVPEPGRAMLLLMAGLAVCLRRSRNRHF